MTHPIPCPKSLPTPSHMYMVSVKTKPSLCYINDHFSIQTIFFINQNSLDDSQYQFAFPKFRVFMHLWAINFRVYNARRRTPFQHFYGLSPSVIMSNCECRVFHPRRGSTPTCDTQHTNFSFSKPCDSFWTLSHVTEPTIEHQTYFRLTMYPRHPIEHQKQCRLLPCTHTHAMRCPSA